MRLRAAAFGASAISGLRSANHSFSWSFTRSHGGFPSTQSKPPTLLPPPPPLEHLRKRQMPVEELVLPRQPLDLPALRRRQRVRVRLQPPQRVGGDAERGSRPAPAAAPTPTLLRPGRRPHTRHPRPTAGAGTPPRPPTAGTAPPSLAPRPGCRPAIHRSHALRDARPPYSADGSATIRYPMSRWPLSRSALFRFLSAEQTFRSSPCWA